MEESKSNRSWIIAVAALSLICLGAVCLATSFPLGLLAIREALAVDATPGQSATPTPVLAVTATLPSTTQSTVFSTSSPISAQDTVVPGSTKNPAQPTPLVETATAVVPSPTLRPVLVDSWCVPWNSPSEQAVVTRVIDGVTIEVTLAGETHQVRYIGIDLLEFESDPAIWEQMTEKNRQLVEGKTVMLVEGLLKEEDGELLRYALADGVFINLELVRSGYAVALSMPPDIQCDPLFLEAEAAAIRAQRGLWGPAPTPTRTQIPPTSTVSPFGPLVVMKVSQGAPWQEPDEFVEIYNSGTDPVQLEGWSISDNENHLFIFPKFVLGAVQFCRVYTNIYAPDHCGFSYYSPSPIWDNLNDCAYLKDKNGRLIDEFCYE